MKNTRPKNKLIQYTFVEINLIHASLKSEDILGKPLPTIYPKLSKQLRQMRKPQMLTEQKPSTCSKPPVFK